MAEARSRRALMNFIVARRYRRFAELGVAQGLTLFSMMKWQPVYNLLEEYVAIDVWKDYHNGQHTNEMWETYYKLFVGLEKEWKALKVVRKKTVDAASDFPDCYFDIVFVDADHRYDSVVADIRAWLPKIREGGIMLGHDYHYSDVKEAVHFIFKEPFTVYAKRTWAFELSRNYLHKILDKELQEKMFELYGKP